MFQDTDLHRLIGAMYDATLDPQGWIPFLRAYAGALNATMAGLINWDRASKGSQIPIFIGMDPQHAREYDEYYAARNPWLAHGRFQRAGFVVPSQVQHPMDALLKSEFYNDYLQRCDLCFGIGARIAHTETLCINLTLLRPKRSGPYDRRDVRIIRTLMPHLQRGFQLHRRFMAIGSEVAAATDAMERMAFGVLLLADDGVAVFVNREARRILDQRDGLFLERDGLRTSSPETTIALRTFIGEAALTSKGAGTSAGGPISVGRPSMKRPLGILVAPLGSDRFPLAPRRAAVAVFVSDPERAVEPSENVIRGMYGLTAAEATLAVLMASGHSVESAAAVLDISVLTARTHLKRVFRKTGAGTQTQLVRLLLDRTVGLS